MSECDISKETVSRLEKEVLELEAKVKKNELRISSGEENREKLERRLQVHNQRG